MASYYYSLIVLSHILSNNHAAPARTCIDQQPYLDVTIDPKPGDKYKICLILNNNKAGCLKKDKMSYACDDPSNKHEPWKPHQKLCKTVDCGSEAQFGIKDGKGCRNSEPLRDLTFDSINNIRCEFDVVGEGYCNGGNQESCTWTVPAPQCPDATSTAHPQIFCEQFICQDGTVVTVPTPGCTPAIPPCPDCVPEGGTWQGNADQCMHPHIPDCDEGYKPWFGDCGCGCIPIPECVSIGVIFKETAECERIVCRTDTGICEDGTMVTRNPSNNCDFTPCPAGFPPPVQYGAKSSGDLTDKSDTSTVNNQNGLNDIEALSLNTGISVGACSLILVACLCCYYLIKKHKGNRIYNNNKKDVDDDTETEDEQQDV